MAGSRRPGAIGLQGTGGFVPERTCGPLGRFDAADPSLTTLLGDTPGPLGMDDWASPSLPDSSSLHAAFAGGVYRNYDGYAVALAAGGLSLQAGAPIAITAWRWDDVRADFEHWEGKCSHMYLDTVGFVTVGVGKMLPNASAARALAFVRRSDGAAATAEEITADYNQVAKQARGMLAASYKPYTKLDLPGSVIGDLLRKMVDDFDRQLDADFAGYANYPACAKRALLDMIYNLGTAGLLKFKQFKASVEAGDWKMAAERCHRNGPSAERNDWTREIFLRAARESAG